MKKILYCFAVKSYITVCKYSHIYVLFVSCGVDFLFLNLRFSCIFQPPFMSVISQISNRFSRQTSPYSVIFIAQTKVNLIGFMLHIYLTGYTYK